MVPKMRTICRQGIGCVLRSSVRRRTTQLRQLSQQGVGGWVRPGHRRAGHRASGCRACVEALDLHHNSALELRLRDTRAWLGALETIVPIRVFAKGCSMLSGMQPALGHLCICKGVCSRLAQTSTWRLLAAPLHAFVHIASPRACIHKYICRGCTPVWTVVSQHVLAPLHAFPCH